MDLYSAPYWVVMAVLSTGAVLAACGGHIVFRRLVRYRDLVAHNDVAGFTIAVIGVIYAVLLAFVVVVVWEQYNDADSRYGEEVSAIADISGYARALPQAQRVSVQAIVAHYVRLMVHDEWPAMLTGGQSTAAGQVLADMAIAIEGERPKDLHGALLQERLIEAQRRAADDRQRRLSDNENTLPQVMWVTLLGGAVVTVAFGYLFGVENFRAQLAMTALVAVLIALSFTLLIELDFPFRRDAALTADRWVFLQHSLDSGRIGTTLPLPLGVIARARR